MGKYICLCGTTFKKKEHTELHMKMHEDLELSEGFPRHKIFKQHWQARFATWLLNLSGEKIGRFLGVYLIYFIVISHFHVEWSIIEATLVGIGLGLII